MKLKQLLVTLLSTAAITGSVVIGSTTAQACPLSSKLPTATQTGQSPQLNNPTTTNSVNLAGIALLSGLLAVGGVYWSRRFVTSDADAVVDAENTVALSEISTVEQVKEERELVGSRK